jgi:TATA-binding protein-associated factor
VSNLLSGIDVREKLARQRQLLNARLGLDVALRIGMDMSEIFSTEDLTISLEADVSRNDPLRVSVCKDLSALVGCVLKAF